MSRVIHWSSCFIIKFCAAWVVTSKDQNAVGSRFYPLLEKVRKFLATVHFGENWITMEPDSVIAEIDEGLTRAGKLDAINADETTNLSFSDRHVSEVEADLPDEPSGGLEVSAGCHDGGASTEAQITKIVAPIVAGPPPPQPPRLFVLPAQQNTPRSAPLFVMPTRPVVTQVTPAVTVPQVQQVVAAVSMIPPTYQYVPLPQFQQPLPQYYQQPNISVSQRPMMQMHPAMQQMSNPFGQSTLIPPVVVGDPMNDMASWSEHEAEDKRKYWYNRVNGTSTYDKPFCLKTPEERSIPSCKWKEYTSADDKKYYSDGKESRSDLIFLLFVLKFKHNFPCVSLYTTYINAITTQNTIMIAVYSC